MRKAAIATCICLIAQSLVVRAAQYSPQEKYAVEWACGMGARVAFKAKGVEISLAAERNYCRCLLESLEDQISFAEFTRFSRSDSLLRDLQAHAPLTAEQQAFMDRLGAINSVTRKRCDCYITTEQDTPKYQEPSQSVPFCPS